MVQPLSTPVTVFSIDRNAEHGVVGTTTTDSENSDKTGSPSKLDMKVSVKPRT